MCRPAVAEKPSDVMLPPFPKWSHILPLCLVSMAHTYSLSGFFAYAGFLAVDLGWSQDADHSGIAVGVLGTLLPAARIPVSLLWGLAMDRFGRRPCLVLTSILLMLGQLLFPFMTSWTAAVVVRFVLLGMGNGWVVFMAVCCSELGGPTHQAAILGYVIGAGGLINLIGPGVGGYTYHIWNSPFPALAPCLLGAALSLAAAVASWALFPETRPARRGRSSRSDEGQDGKAKTSTTAEAPDVTLRVALCTAPLPVLVALRCLLGFCGFLLMTVVPLWGIASEAVGGLELDNKWLGLMLSSSAVIGLGYSTLFMARVIKFLGVKRAMIGSALVQFAAIVALPRLQFAPFACVVLLHAILNVANTTCFTTTISAVNNICSRYPHQRGAINGVSVTVESAAKALGPGLGGSLYAWAVAQRVPAGFPSASVLYFSGFAVLFCAFAVGATTLPVSINRAATPADETMRELEMKSAPEWASVRRKHLPPRVRWLPGSAVVLQRNSTRGFHRLPGGGASDSAR